MYDQERERGRGRRRAPGSNAPAGEMQLRVFGPQGERLKHFPEDYCKALRE
jgi:hypothetical protein